MSGWDKPTLDWWRGPDGDEYMRRNEPTAQYIAMRAESFKAILARLPAPPASILEVGCGPGANLAALSSILRTQLTYTELKAIEPNPTARRIARARGCGGATIRQGHAGEIPFASIDLVLTCGVLIHLDPTKEDGLKAAIREIYRVARRYILIMEYFSKQPTEIKYRGDYDGILWKLDYGSEFLAAHPDLLGMDYGFLWSRRTAFDDLNWWLFQKPEAQQPEAQP